MSTQPPSTPIFNQPALEPPSRPLFIWVLAAAVVLVILGGTLLLTHHKSVVSAHATLPLDPYAQSLVISQIVMSESTSLSGGKSTFIDGHIRNTGSRTVTGATVQVLFGNFDPAQAPQLETTPLTLIRTHQPYIDIEPIREAPLAPGDDREFRLIFEDISPGWNQQLPEIHPVRVTSR